MDPSARRLEIAVGAAILEVLTQVAVLIGRGTLAGAPLRIVFLALKLPLCWGAYRRRPGGYLGVWLWEIGAVVAALSVRGAPLARAATIAGASVVMVLLGRAISAFPTVEWRAR
ncbi:MAG: hypothetical protein QOI61_1439 [Actinomycetota bacterium]|jgi:hypothetical protein